MPPLSSPAEAVFASAPARVIPFRDRALALLARAGIAPEHVSPVFAQLLVRTASAVLASLAAGDAPPLTFPGRFGALDAHLASLLSASPRRILDVGCGFPPVTSLELARRFPSAEIVAIDPSLPASELELPGGARAFFDEAGAFRFALAGGALVVKEDPPSPVERAAMERMAATSHLSPEERGARDPMAPLRDQGVRFVRARAPHVPDDLGPASAIRAMNVLFYLPPPERAAFFEWAARALDEGGVLLEGVNFLAGTELHFAVHERRGAALRCVHIGFSIDCARSFGPFPWMELHDDPAPARLAGLVGHLRADPSFRGDLDAALDAALARRGLLERRGDGHLYPFAPLSPPALADALAGVLADLDAAGFTERAAAVLRAAGLDAARGEPGHVLVRL